MRDFTFSVRGQLRTIGVPCISGILNVTDDSFYAGSRITDKNKLLTTAEAMIIHGASILDIGAVSTRPGANLFTEKDEIQRLIPYLKSLRKQFPDILISVDTFRSGVAMIASDEGADIINDISGGTMDERMFHVVASLKLPYILMHIQGTPENMHKKTQYSDLMNDINNFFAKQIHHAQEYGVHDIIIDPGFGFGKTIEQNFEILRKLDLLRIHNKPVYVGLSRKSMIYTTLGSTPDHALTGTIALHTLALTKGADILRVHDVKEASEVVNLMKKMISLQ